MPRQSKTLFPKRMESCLAPALCAWIVEMDPHSLLSDIRKANRSPPCLLFTLTEVLRDVKLSCSALSQDLQEDSKTRCGLPSSWLYPGGHGLLPYLPSYLSSPSSHNPFFPLNLLNSQEAGK